MILFCFLTSCSKNQDTITLQWQDDKAIGVSIPQTYFPAIPDDSLSALVTVHLVKPGVQPAILGKFIFNNGDAIFQPIIPFTPGLQYEIRVRNKVLEQISVPLPDAKYAAKVLKIFPTQDTLPHNLLKFYVMFSLPMSEGRALQHILLIRNEKDTVQLAFLDLKPELWNHDGTLLTLWLDPGRIKRDLQPNKKMGAPLQRGDRYELAIDPSWNDARGSALQQSFSKKFFVAQRDSLSPDPQAWAIQSPPGQSRDALIVDLHESLDYVLLIEAISVADESGNPVAGRIELAEEESKLRFTPDYQWKPGTYALQSESRLEDLAGNNLNRPFDKDLTQHSASKTQKTFARKFVVE